MATHAKIKILDDAPGRQALDERYSSMSQVALCRYALQLARHIMEVAGYDDPQNPAITTGFAVNEQWQTGQARMHDVRQAGFAVHKLARQAPDELTTTVLRVVGQAIGTGHMPEHAMVASDYAIKVINLLHPGDATAAQRERQWQLRAMGIADGDEVRVMVETVQAAQPKAAKLRHEYDTFKQQYGETLQNLADR